MLYQLLQRGWCDSKHYKSTNVQDKKKLTGKTKLEDQNM